MKLEDLPDYRLPHPQIETSQNLPKTPLCECVAKAEDVQLVADFTDVLDNKIKEEKLVDLEDNRC